MARIEKDSILAATDGGKNVILDYYPQASVGFTSRRNFKLRADDRNPSAAVFLKEGVWFIQDKGGSDNKAYSAISLVMENERLNFPQALEFIASKFAPHLLDERKQTTGPRPRMERATPSDRLTVKVAKREFTQRELDFLGYKINQTTCEELCLKPVESYVSRCNDKGQSWEFFPTEEYPIYYYDYGNWGKIYQPLGELRFLYAGEKPSNFIFGGHKFLRLYEEARKGVFPEIDKDTQIDERWEHLILCSGPSDALNISAAGYHVCWLNSESATLNQYDYSLLTRLAKNLYICYDIDSTGINKMYELALQYLDLKILILPESLGKIRTRRGKFCKDAKDFFVHYRRPDQQNPHKLFEQLVKLSFSLKFWVEKRDRKGDFVGYDINNEQLYSFLAACGFWKIETSTNKKEFTYCFIKDNVVKLISEEKISAACSAYLIEYLREHPEYYSQMLVNAIHRSNQIKLGSLDKLRTISPNFKSYDKYSDTIFFRNATVRISKEDIEALKPGSTDFFVYDHKIIDHDFTMMEPLFEIEFSEEYATLKNLYKASDLPQNSPERAALKKKLDSFPDTARYNLTIRDNQFSFLRYIYNTGRAYWRKEELGHPLSAEEKKEVELHFINKVCALGYQIFKYKEAGLAYGIYAMELESSDVGTHLGGTGKSLFISSIEQVRKQLFINGQDLNMNDAQFLFSGVERGVTDHVFFDDLNEFIDLHRFMPMITGKMSVNAKYQNAFTLDFSDSPRVAFTSNHGIKNFDASLRRRTWFTAFSSYYHPDDPMRGLKERSPFTEFGKNLITDYTTGEMNQFYNFMLQCLQTFLRFRERIQPPMGQIEKRNIQRAIGDEFIWWAEDYFNADRLNVLINKHTAFEAYKATLNEKTAKMIKINTFKNRLIQFCQYNDWVFNPPGMLTSETEKERNEIRRKENGEDAYFYFISTYSTGKKDVDDYDDLPL